MTMSESSSEFQTTPSRYPSVFKRAEKQVEQILDLHLSMVTQVKIQQYIYVSSLTAGQVVKLKYHGMVLRVSPFRTVSVNHGYHYQRWTSGKKLLKNYLF